MNKKYLSVLLFGAMIATTAGTFTSCKDYDDDIDGLRTEINDNATAAASELASKVTELKNQITSLESAKDKLSTELAAAKQEAATAAANALSAAQKAQAAADAAQKGGDEAKAAAAAAQQTADKATKDLASAVARVATLETKVASLESAVADLKKADSEFSSRLTVLENSIKLNQEAIATNKNGIAENKQAIADANAAILAKATELNSAINDLSVKVGAQIDVINAELNTIKSNYATKDELNSKYQELAAMDAQLKNQIETNANYISALQATVKDLAAKDAELASKIESNYNAVIEKLNATNTELTAASKKIEAIENTVNSLSSQYSALQSAKADLTYVDNINNQLTTLINSLQSTLNDLSTSNASQDRTIGELLTSVKNLQEKTQDLQNQVDKNDAAQTAALQSAVAQLQKEIADAVKAAQDELTVAVEDVKSLAESNKDEIETIKTDLAKKAEQSVLDALAADLVENYATVAGVNAEIAAVQSDLAAQKSELEGKIAAAKTFAQEYADKIVKNATDRITVNEGNIKKLQELMTQLTNISGDDLSAFVTDNKMSTAINDALDEFYNGISDEFLGQTEFTEWATRELRGEILSNYVTNDALSQTLADYVTKETYDQKMEELDKIISNDVEGEERGLTQRIADCESYLRDLGLVNESISKRLTSITLVPNHYIDGIEAINFKTLKYTIYKNNVPVTYRLTNDKGAKVTYRMNPSGVTLDCIDKDNVSYIANLATTRASVESPIKVTGCEVDEDGDLVVNVKKIDSYVNRDLGNRSDGKIWIAALSIPINKNYWTVEDENAVVYSEYTRLSETVFTPMLIKKGVAHTTADIHLWDKDYLYSSKVNEAVYQEFAYNSDPIDLMTLVDVCEGDGGSHVTFEDYESYGLKIVFDIPTDAYSAGVPDTDQQEFAYLVDKTHIASCVYDKTGDVQYTNNKAAVGREPIVRARLVDTNHDNNIVSEKYFKIKWTNTTPKDLGCISTSEEDFSCSGFAQLLNTQEMNQLIYGNEKVNMASTTFHTIYPDENLEKDGGVGTVTVIKNKINGVTSYNLNWSITEGDFYAVQSNPFTNDKELVVNYLWKAADGSGDIKFSMKKTVKAPSFGIKGHNGSFWDDNYSVLTMNPIVYGTENAKDLCVINADLVNNFAAGNQPATSMLDAITKSNFVDLPGDAQILFKSGNGYNASADGKTLYKGNEVAATIEAKDDKQILVLREETATGKMTYGTAQYGTAQSHPTAAALSLIGKNIPVKVLVDACGDGVYTYTAKDFNVKIKEPFKINSDLNEVFYESRVNGSRISVANALTMTDWNGYVVAQAADGTLGTAEKYKWTNTLYSYYGIKKVEWDTKDATTNIVKDGNGNLVPTAGKRNKLFPDGASFDFDATANELVYKNNGVVLNKEFEIYCPVKVTYKWGVAEVVGGVTITVKAGSGI